MLKEAFDACLHALVEHVGEGTCSCFDEETVLTHIYQRLAPCKDLPVKRPVAKLPPPLRACAPVLVRGRRASLRPLAAAATPARWHPVQQAAG